MLTELSEPSTAFHDSRTNFLSHLPGFPYTYNPENLTSCPENPSRPVTTLKKDAKRRIAEQTIDLSGIQGESRWCSSPFIFNLHTSHERIPTFFGKKTAPCVFFRWVHTLIINLNMLEYPKTWVSYIGKQGKGNLFQGA